MKGELEAAAQAEQGPGRASRRRPTSCRTSSTSRPTRSAPVEKALDVKVDTTPFVTRAQVQQLALGNAKFVQALFSPESIQGKRNTEAIEIGPNALMAGRIVEYKPAAPRPFDDVKDEIRRQLVARGASELAQKAGREKLALLEQGKSEKEAGVAFGKPVDAAARPAAAGLHARRA